MKSSFWKYPKTKVRPVAELVHGHKIVDQYRWLENGKSAAVKKWVVRQNMFADRIFKRHGASKFKKELIAYFRGGSVSPPFPVRGKYFWTERKALENQPVLYIKDGLKGKLRALVNPNKLKKEGTVSLDYWYVSPRGSYVSYGLSEGGTEMSTLYVMEVATRKLLKDKIPYARYGGVQWLADESGFYYHRHPKPGSVPKGDEHYYMRAYFHKLGSDPDKDKLIFKRRKEDMISLSISADGRYLAIEVTDNWIKNDVYLYDKLTGKTRPIIVGKDARFIVSLIHGGIYTLTNYKAEKYRLLYASLPEIPKSIDNWKTLIRQTEDTLLFVDFTSDKMLAEYLHNACSIVKVFDYGGHLRGKLPLPSFSTIDKIGAREEESEFFFKVVSFLSAGTIYRYDDVKNSYSIYHDERLKLNPRNYSVRQEWYRSKDKVKIPIFVLYKRSIRRNGKNPTLLYGYGGFNESITPSFGRSWLPFVKRGGIFAIANIRGGGEFGKKWHREGILDKKQNSFSDFIAAAEFLMRRKYTNPRKLAILGGSNGGLLTGACMVQRPDLFRAVVSKVPLLDMIRFPRFLIAARWINEYGNPRKKGDFLKIIKWSPYHNVNKSAVYPSTLLTTADKDFRVDPLHARKMTALLQSLGGPNSILLRTETEAGHGSGKPLNKIIGEQADILAFLSWQLALSE